MQKLALTAFAVIALTSPAASAQSSRVDTLNRVSEGLNSPNPALRVATLEEAMAGDDRTLKQFALQQAFASNDMILRSVATQELFRQNPTVIIELLALQPNGNSRNDERGSEFLNASGGTIDLIVSNFDPNSGDFTGTSSYSYVFANGEIRSYIGNVSGDRFSFKVDINEVYSGSECYGVLRSSDEGGVFEGNVNCVLSSVEPLFSARAQLLR